MTGADPGRVARGDGSREARRRSLLERAAASWVIRFLITVVILVYLGSTIDMAAAARAVVAIDADVHGLHLLRDTPLGVLARSVLRTLVRTPRGSPTRRWVLLRLVELTAGARRAPGFRHQAAVADNRAGAISAAVEIQQHARCLAARHGRPLAGDTVAIDRLALYVRRHRPDRSDFVEPLPPLQPADGPRL